MKNDGKLVENKRRKSTRGGARSGTAVVLLYAGVTPPDRATMANRRALS